MENVSQARLLFVNWCWCARAPRARACSEIVQLTDILRGHIVDVALDSIVVEITGPESRINSFLDLTRVFLASRNMVRTGRVAMSRGLNSVTRERKSHRAARYERPRAAVAD